MEPRISEIRLTPSADPDFGTFAGQAESATPAQLALQELLESEGVVIYETLEEMGMALSGKLQEQQNALNTERRARRQQALFSLVKEMQDEPEMAFHMTAVNDDHPDQSVARQIVTLAMAMAAEVGESTKKQSLKSRLDALTETEGWELAIFSMIELGSVDCKALASLQRLMQQSIDDNEEMSLSDWFRRVADWPDRRERVRILLRAMAFELSVCVDGGQKRRLAAVLTRLRRLSLFLGLEKECQREEIVCQLPPNSLLPLLLDMIGERWLFGDWLLERLAPLVASARMLNRLLQLLDAQFTLMPDNCLDDEFQREQILETLRQLKGI